MTNRDACLGFMAGAIVGAAAALLYAPQSGAETRNRLRSAGADAGQKAREASLKAKEVVLETKNEVETSISQAVAKVTANADRLATAASRGRDAFKESLVAQA